MTECSGRKHTCNCARKEGEVCSGGRDLSLSLCELYTLYTADMDFLGVSPAVQKAKMAE